MRLGKALLINCTPSWGAFFYELYARAGAVCVVVNDEAGKVTFQCNMVKRQYGY